MYLEQWFSMPFRCAFFRHGEYVIGSISLGMLLSCHRYQPQFEKILVSSLLQLESRMSAKLASLGLFKGRYGVNQPKPKEANKASGLEVKKEIDRQEEEITRSKSSDAGHRLHLLDKALRLLAIQNTTSVEEELELLLAGLSI